MQVYDEKSDIWALGCILYEMAALQKTFEGSNLPALVNKIMKGQFAPIRGNYTPLFKQLVRWDLGSFSLHVILNPQLTIMCSIQGPAAERPGVSAERRGAAAEQAARPDGRERH